MNKTGLTESMQRNIQNTIASEDDKICWVNTSAKDKETVNEFRKIVSSTNLSDRVKETMNVLFQASSYQTLKQ